MTTQERWGLEEGPKHSLAFQGSKNQKIKGKNSHILEDQVHFTVFKTKQEIKRVSQQNNAKP